MENQFGWNPATLSAAAAAAALLVLIVAALFTRKQVEFARQQVTLARELQEEQSRPHVFVDFDLYAERGTIYLAVENVGKTVAKNVKLSFNPPPESTITDEPIAESIFLKDGIPTLPPGKRLLRTFDFALQRFNSDLPMTYQVQVTYEDRNNNQCPTEEHTLDLSFYQGFPLSIGKSVTDVANSLEGIETEISKWTADTHGVDVYTTDRLRRDRKRTRRMKLRRLQQSHSLAGLLKSQAVRLIDKFSR